MCSGKGWKHIWENLAHKAERGKSHTDFPVKEGVTLQSWAVEYPSESEHV